MRSKKVTDVIRMADAHRAGARGYDCKSAPESAHQVRALTIVPFSFSLRCRAYWSNRDAYRP
jgi:hypothetical protein